MAAAPKCVGSFCRKSNLVSSPVEDERASLAPYRQLTAPEIESPGRRWRRNSAPCRVTKTVLYRQRFSPALVLEPCGLFHARLLNRAFILVQNRDRYSTVGLTQPRQTSQRVDTVRLMDTTLRQPLSLVDWLLRPSNQCGTTTPKAHLPPEWECWLWLAIFVGVILLFQWSR